MFLFRLLWAYLSKSGAKVQKIFHARKHFNKKIIFFAKNFGSSKKSCNFAPNFITKEGTTIATQPGRPQHRGRVEKDFPNRINDMIRGVNEVRLVGENVEQGVYPFAKAMHMADEMNLDLVEISPNAVPPVCRIVDYQKFLYQKKKKEKEIKANSKKIEVKEIRFGPQTDEHDFNFKLKHAEEFLKDGNKVKAYVFFRGRSIVFKEQGELLLARFADALAELGKAEALPKLEGKRMILMLAPKGK